MERTTEIENSVKEAVTSCLDTSTGWADLAKVGVVLRQKGVEYGKLSLFFNSFEDIVEVRTDNSTNPPVKYARLKSQASRNSKPARVKIARPSNPRNALKEWALLVKYNQHHPKPNFHNLAADLNRTMYELWEKVLKGEKWHYGETENPSHFPILESYLQYTFYRLQKEDEYQTNPSKKKIVELDNYACFNTGLVDKRYRPIYAMFTKNSHVTQKWQLLDFCIESEGYAGKEMVRNFSPSPARAHYFDKPADMLYDITCGKPKTDLHHIVVERTSRLPIKLLQDNCPRSFTWQDPTKMDAAAKKRYFCDLGQAIDADEVVCREIESKIDKAIDLAMKRVEWNFKTAIPMYFPTMNIMSLLLPLSIIKEDEVNAALVVEKTKANNYIGHTILTLEMAYSNARLVSRPDSDWLAVEKIDNLSTDEIDEE